METWDIRSCLPLYCFVCPKDSPALVQIEKVIVFLFVPGRYRVDAEGNSMPESGYIVLPKLFSFDLLSDVEKSG
ncbi:hypothetical protein EON65_36125 [archaeon]|nr:MAG: hypothetical protein EON65_36125 [archaeon]